MSALLFHGVGVGKTCSAITVAESYLDAYPKKQVLIIAPRNIQPNFNREIFSEAKLQMGDDEEPNEYLGCTGNTYLTLTGNEFSRDKSALINRINHVKARRYQLVGYLAFYNYLRDLMDREISKSLKDKERKYQEYLLLKKKFSNRLIIIDEAHNVRDLTEADEENKDAPGGKAEVSESQAGKKLTPYLKKLLGAAEGTKLLLLSATPMYNNYKEIIPLLNLLRINDKKAPVSESNFFTPEGEFLEGGEAAFGKAIQPYVSFMRGENPLAFPIRLEPTNIPRLTVWPQANPLGDRITNEEVRTQITRLPFVPVEYTGEGLTEYRNLVGKMIVSSGLRLGATDGLVQAGNFLFPGIPGTPGEARIREQGFKGCFTESKDPRQYSYASGVDPTWLHESNLTAYSPKCALLLKRLRSTKGVSFVYSRFVYSGALAIALALEANGYENAERPSGYLRNPVLSPGGKQCALCEKKQGEHAGSDHSFKQAKYVLLTGRDDLTPHNKASIEKSTRVSNKDGEEVKVVLGSQVASEGIDLKFIREVVVFDSWFHLNKLEQVIGRGIRFCSHAALPWKKRNCTVVLLLTAFPRGSPQETIDMYQYRMGFEKASQIGKITRVMKQYAVDCNVNHGAVLIEGMDPIKLEDSQGLERDDGNINDVPFTSLCDWIGSCGFECKPTVEVNPIGADDSLYDAYSARWRMYQIKQRLRLLFETQSWYRYDDLLHLMDDYPRIVVSSILKDIVGNRTFRIQVKGQRGYIIYKNGLYLFQPEKLLNQGAPLALRRAIYPIKQDSYEDIVEILPTKPSAPSARAVVEQGPLEEEAVVQEVGEGLDQLWAAAVQFFELLGSGALPDRKVLPDALEALLKVRYGDNKKAFDKVYQNLSMFSRLYQDVKANPEWREALSVVGSKFFWDEVLNGEEQYSLYESKKSSADEMLTRVWKEHLVEFEGETIYRRVNPFTGKLEYKCNGEPCSPALVSALEAEDESTDPIRQLRANDRTTGNPYGTLNFKKGVFVFKTNVPVKPSPNPAVREKQERGSECANVANMVPHYKLLETIGQIAQAAVGTNLGFTLAELKEAAAPRGVKNSTRACSLTDIALRFFDELEIQGKRWFYRPLATFYTKHPGKTA